MKTRKTMAPAGVLLLSLLLAACSEPSQPAAVTAPTAGDELAGESSAPPVIVDAVKPVELSLDERRLPLTPDTACNFERANGTVFAGMPLEVSKTAPATLSGWVADQLARDVPSQADLRLVGVEDKRAWKIAVETGRNRDDVVKLLDGETAYASAGYGVTVDFSAMPSGSYRMYTVFAGSDGLRVCDNGRSITLVD